MWALRESLRGGIDLTNSGLQRPLDIETAKNLLPWHLVVYFLPLTNRKGLVLKANIDNGEGGTEISLEHKSSPHNSLMGADTKQNYDVGGGLHWPDSSEKLLLIQIHSTLATRSSTKTLHMFPPMLKDDWEEYKGGGKRKGKSKEKRRKRKEDEEEKEKERKKSGKQKKNGSSSSGNGGAGREEEEREESREENKLFCSGEIRESEREKEKEYGSTSIITLYQASIVTCNSDPVVYLAGACIDSETSSWCLLTKFAISTFSKKSRVHFIMDAESQQPISPDIDKVVRGSLCSLPWLLASIERPGKMLRVWKMNHSLGQFKGIMGSATYANRLLAMFINTGSKWSHIFPTGEAQIQDSSGFHSQKELKDRVDIAFLLFVK
ncbi:hypothetical protein Celaphus_00012747, partial [Cervus elaphus hippelaphus]